MLSRSVCLECVLCIWEGLSLASFFPVCSLYIFFFFYEMTCSSRMSFREGPCNTILFTTLSFSPWNLKIGKLLSLTRNIRPFQFSHALEHHVLALYYTFLCEYHKELVIFVEPRTYLESWVIDIDC